MITIIVIAALIAVYVGIRTWQKTQEARWGGPRPVSIAERMRRLRFVDVGDGYWHKETFVGDNTTFNLTINPETGKYRIDVLDHLFGWEETYGKMKPDYRDAIVSEIDALVKSYRDLGFDIVIDHSKYGVVKEEVDG